MSLDSDDLLRLLRPAFQREIAETIPKIYFEALTDGEMVTLALLYRTVYERVQADETPPGRVVEMRLVRSGIQPSG